ncbi:MAG: hypothetical protein DLM70_18320 [Chloroflexi bacterium]|nr:MAG: hypothetical protein DLM70_18320 [Chloroflexota bacterium]
MHALVIALIALFVGVAGSAAAFFYMPDSGSAPSIYDSFNFSSTANGFWHVYTDGADATIKHGMLTLSGHTLELDRRLQTDPKETVVALRIRGRSFHKFGAGLGIYHAGTLGLEFDDDGIKCGRGTDHGYAVDTVRGWTAPPANQWFYLLIAVINPYPNPKVLAKLGNVDYSQLKKVTLRCAIFDAQGHLLAEDTAKHPPPNAHYAGLDEAYMRTWDSRNNYQIAWFNAGPPGGDPLNAISRQTF